MKLEKVDKKKETIENLTFKLINDKTDKLKDYSKFYYNITYYKKSNIEEKASEAIELIILNNDEINIKFCNSNKKSDCYKFVIDSIIAKKNNSEVIIELEHSITYTY